MNDLFLLNEMWFLLLSGVFIGLTLGSFVTMLSYRVPRGLSIVRPPSRCTQCQTFLRPRDLIPVLSWILAGGRCSVCHTRISPRYPLIELVTMMLVAGAFVTLGFSVYLLFALVLIVAAVTGATLRIESRAKKKGG